MAKLVGVHIAHILEAAEIRHFARRQEGVGTEVARQECQAVKGDGGELGAIRDRLLDGVLSLALRFLALPARPFRLRFSCALSLRIRLSLWGGTGPSLRGLLVLRPGRAGVALLALRRRRREVTQFVGIKPGRLDGVIHCRAAAQASLAECLVDGFCLLSGERFRVILGENGLHLRLLRVS